MNLKQAVASFTGRDGERAVSPVIGVILMVAITVILAAVIGTFVLGLGDRVGQAQPSVTWSYDYTTPAGNNADIVSITHDGGAAVNSKQVTVNIGGQKAWDGSPTSQFSIHNGNDWSGELTAGAKLSLIEDSTSVIQSGDKVKIIWTASGSDKTAVIGESEVE